MSNQTYDVLKKIALVVAPLATFISALCIIWGVPYSEQITATLAAFDAFLGSLIGVSSYNHNKPYQIGMDTYLDDEEVEAKEVE